MEHIEYHKHQEKGYQASGEADAYSKVLLLYKEDLPQSAVDWLYNERAKCRSLAIAEIQKAIEALEQKR